jgi:DNA (cytosine-5)-methyltransferase 1
MMQGFPKDFKFPVSTSSAMKQLGNSVAVWAVQDYAMEIVKVLEGKVS